MKITSSLITDSEAARQKVIIKDSLTSLSAQTWGFCLYLTMRGWFTGSTWNRMGLSCVCSADGWSERKKLEGLTGQWLSYSMQMWGRTRAKRQTSGYSTITCRAPVNKPDWPTYGTKISSLHFCMLSLLMKPWTWNSQGSSLLLMLSRRTLW